MIRRIEPLVDINIISISACEIINISCRADSKCHTWINRFYRPVNRLYQHIYLFSSKAYDILLSFCHCRSSVYLFASKAEFTFDAAESRIKIIIHMYSINIVILYDFLLLRLRSGFFTSAFAGL